MKNYITLIIVCTIIAPAAAQESPIKVVTLDRKTPVSYVEEVEEILTNKCMFCHSGSVKEGKFDMGSYEALVKGGASGPAVVPGKPDESYMIKLAGHTTQPIMPPEDEDPVTPEELALLKLWVQQGAKGPSGAVAKVEKSIKVGRLPARVTPVMAVAVSPDNSTIAAGRANHIHLYEAGSGAAVRTLVDENLKTSDGEPVRAAHRDIVQSLVCSPDGLWLASAGFQQVKIWDIKVRTGMLRHTLTGFADRVLALDFSSDGKLLATGGGVPSQDGEIRIFEVVSGKQILDIKNGHSDTVFGVCFSPDGTKLATCGADKFVKVFEVPSGKLLKSFEGHTHHVMDVGWKPDGKLLATAGADDAIKIWDYEKGEQVRTINGHKDQVNRLQFIGDKPEFATCSGDKTIRFWNVDRGNNIRNFSGNNDFVYAIGVSPDGKILAAGGQEGIVRVYDGSNGKLLKSLAPPE